MPEECAERIRLIDAYGSCLAEYSARPDALKGSRDDRNEGDWNAAETALASSQRTWEALQRHIAEHQCLDLHWSSGDPADTGASGHILAKAAVAALDVILVADDDRRFVAVNEAAADLLGLPRSKIVGRRIEEFFSEARGEAIPAAWDSFLSEGLQCGICELKGPGRRRRFEYRAKANFAPGLHLSVLREHPRDW
jgi:PAS domain-containing protein